MKEIPYFKFYTGEYLTGEITVCDMQTQGVFINLCCYYWNKQGSICLAIAKKRFKQNENELNNLIEMEIIKVDEEENIFIDFLDEQLNERDALHVKRVMAGRKGGQASAKQSSSKAQAKSSNIEEKRKEKEKKKNYTDFVKLTEKEYEACIEKHGESDTNRAIKTLNDYKQAHDKKYKSDYGALNSWVWDKIAKSETSDNILVKF